MGKRVRKDCLEIKVLGDIDELNGSLGVLASGLQNSKFKNEIKKIINIQHNLFVIGSNVASLDLDAGKVPKLKEDDISELENWIDEMEQGLDPLYDFILPGGDVAAAQSFLTRAVCRRCERSLVLLKDEHNELDSLIAQYLNRLSDVLFVLARWLNKKNEIKDVIWKK